MVSGLFIITFLSWCIRVSFRLVFLLSYNLVRASRISFGIFNFDTLDIKWSLIESFKILLALTSFFLNFSLASSSSYCFGSTWWTWSNNSFSYRMRSTLCFQDLKLSAPSSISSTLILVITFAGRNPRYENLQNFKLH